MPKIQVSLTDTPDKLPPISPGERVLEVVSIEDGMSSTNKQMYTICLKVNDEGNKDHNRQVFDYIVQLQTNERSKVRFRRLCKACGLSDLSNVDTSDLVGKSAKCIIVNETYQDASGATQESSKIKDYLF